MPNLTTCAATLSLLLLVSASCRWVPPPEEVEAAEILVDESYRNEILEWQASRATGLQRPTGWLSLTGLSWLDEGANLVGSAESADVRLPAKAPARVGILERSGETVRFVPDPAATATIGGSPAREIEMQPDTSGEQTIVEVGPVQFFVIRRAERVGVRVRDRESDALRSFHGLEYFPIDPRWRVEAKLVPYDPPKQIMIQNIVGTVEPSTSPGALVFTLEGKEYRLDPLMEPEDDEMFVIFADQTSGRETYPAGRYVYADAPGPDGTTILDFNRAYNPPCAFTDFATCPLPPRQNRLPLRVEAGEKNYEGHG